MKKEGIVNPWTETHHKCNRKYHKIKKVLFKDNTFLNTDIANAA